MIYLLHGDDSHAARKKLHALVDSLLEKKPDALYFHTTNESDFDLDELAHAQGLFERKYIVVFDHVLGERGEEVLAALKGLSASDHIFIFLEGRLDKKTLAKIEKHAEKVQVFEGARVEKKDEFKIFALTDALGNRNREKLWTLYCEAQQHKTIEEIHGMLFWQVKNMLLARNINSASSAGLNPFVYKKAKSACKNFKSDELQQLSSKLVSISHNARRGEHDFESALERFILTL